MPLLLITGFPASGKTTIANRVSKFFEDQGFAGKVEVISEETDVNFNRSFYGEYKKEKAVRSALRSAVQRSLDKKTLVICDSLNNVKGYRYELFCLAKNGETKYALLHCDTRLEICKWLNTQHQSSSRYSDEILAALCNRYEPPNPKNRWDSPTYSIQIGVKNGTNHTQRGDSPGSKSLDPHPEIEELEVPEPECYSSDVFPREIPLPLEELYSCLVEGKHLTANQCMRSFGQPKTGTFINELDSNIQMIIKKLLNLQRTAVPGDQFVVLDGEEGQINKVLFAKIRSIHQLTRIRQQFTDFIRSHPVDNVEVALTLFIDFLNKNP